MKSMKTTKIFFILAIGILLVSSCSKDGDYIQQPDVKMEDLQVPGDFDWSTGQILTVSIQGIESASDYRSTLVLSDENGKILLKRAYSVQDNLTVELMVPDRLNEVHLTYGKRIMHASVHNGEAAFSFVQQFD